MSINNVFAPDMRNDDYDNVVSGDNSSPTRAMRRKNRHSGVFELETLNASSILANLSAEDGDFLIMMM